MYNFSIQYDEAREYVERARKCLATELAALVSLMHGYFEILIFFLYCPATISTSFSSGELHFDVFLQADNLFCKEN